MRGDTGPAARLSTRRSCSACSTEPRSHLPAGNNGTLSTYPAPSRSMLGCYNERDKNQLRVYKKTGPPDGGKEFKPAKPGNA